MATLADYRIVVPSKGRAHLMPRLVGGQPLAVRQHIGAGHARKVPVIVGAQPLRQLQVALVVRVGQAAVGDAGGRPATTGAAPGPGQLRAPD